MRRAGLRSTRRDVELGDGKDMPDEALARYPWTAYPQIQTLAIGTKL